MNSYIFIVTFHLIFLQFFDCTNTAYDQVLQPIEIVYPKCFRATGHTEIMVHKEYFNPVHGYAISPFKSPNENRNHFYRRNANKKIKIIVLHFTDLDFGTTVKVFTSKRSSTSRYVSSHYVIARPTEAGTHNQLLQVKHFFYLLPFS